MVSRDSLDFITCSWQRRRYLRTCSLPPPGLYSPNEDLFGQAFHRVSVKRASGQGKGQESTGRCGTRVCKLVDLDNPNSNPNRNPNRNPNPNPN